MSAYSYLESDMRTGPETVSESPHCRDAFLDEIGVPCAIWSLDGFWSPSTTRLQNTTLGSTYTTRKTFLRRDWV
ncbi:hypothetical protein BS17DRAFT_790979 [Gyrodon lividus]|nr:hypothetical protein BS17DRAFT_790979 [Gyrodon lividus]